MRGQVSMNRLDTIWPLDDHSVNPLYAAHSNVSFWWAPARQPRATRANPTDPSLFTSLYLHTGTDGIAIAR